MGFYLTNAKANTNDPLVFMSQQGMGTVQMTQMMNTNKKEAMQKLMQNENVSFNKMLPSLKKMHPGLNDEQLKSLYEQMLGANGYKSCANQGKVAGNN